MPAEPGSRSSLPRVYRNVALFVFNTLLVLTIGSLVADFFIRRTISSNSTRVYSARFEAASYGHTTPEDTQRIGADFDQMGERESYQFNPWTTFMESPFDGEKVHVDPTEPFPTRRTVPPVENGMEELRLWLFGGSTVFGWGVGDENTLASHMQIALQELVPNRKVVVVNHGHSYYFSSMEVALYVALLRENDPPDVVVFFDGINDLFSGLKEMEVPHFTARAERGWDEQRQPLYYGHEEPWFDVNATFPPLRLARYLKLIEAAENPEDSVPFSEKDASGLVLSTIERMRKNRQMATAVSLEYNVRPFFFLQPLGPGQEGNRVFQFAYQQLRAEVDDIFLDVSAPLPRPVESYFVDRSHYGDLGNEIVARRMAERISGLISDPDNRLGP